MALNNVQVLIYLGIHINSKYLIIYIEEINLSLIYKLKKGFNY